MALALTVGSRLGSFDITGTLGAGGMGEVYRATDTNLGRQVAIKVLPEAFAQDAERLARFEREAKTLAALNHPNIAQIYGLEKSDGIRALVMELVEGPTLADRIAQGPVLVDETLQIAKQIVEAIEAAHEQGVIHRDLKPANIKLRPDGVVKVLDFGLAKALDSAPGIDASQSPTITSPAMMTGVGVLLGTAAYMSPEQARGKTVDKRTDIWAFGCVFYEMLTGKRAFDGDNVTDTIAAVVRAEPDWTRLPGDTPLPIQRLLRRCLVKESSGRLRDIGDARFDLNADVTPTSTSVVRPSSRRQWGAAVLLALAGMAVGATAVWQFARATTSVASPTAFAIDTLEDRPLITGPSETSIAVAPNGRYIVYVAASTVQQAFSARTLVIRPLDTFAATPLIRGGGDLQPRSPFVSSDSRWIGFLSNESIMKVSASGGTPTLICECHPSARGGAAWLDDGTIIYNASSGLRAVSDDGRNDRELTKIDVQGGEVEHLGPVALPGSRAVLFTVPGAPATRSVTQILDLATGNRRQLVSGAMFVRYVALGYLVYLDASGALQAIRFDPARGATSGEPIAFENMAVEGSSATGGFDVSQTGMLAYLPGRADVSRTLAWVSRQGREETLNVPPHGYTYPRFSPDGAFVALDVRDLDSDDIWLWNVKRESLSRLTLSNGRNSYPVWTPDSRDLLYVSNRSGSDNVYRQPADGSDSGHPLTNSPNQVLPYAVSPDATMAVLREISPDGGADLALLRLTGTPRIEPLIHSIRSRSEVNADLSPDGNWVVYQSDESGVPEVYVRSFPDVNRQRWQISNGGGSTPLWARNGREIFYMDVNHNLMRVEVGSGESFSVGKPAQFFTSGYSSAGWRRSFAGRAFDLSPDGQRFIVIKDQPGLNSRRTSSIRVVQNWTEELKRLVPTRK